MHGGSHWTSLLELEVCQRTALRNLLLVGCRHLKLFAVSLRQRHRFYVQITLSSRETETNCMLCASTSPMFAYYSSALRNGSQPFSRLHCKIEITEFMVIWLVSFIWAADLAVPDLFLLSRFSALQGEGRLRTSERVLISRSRVLKTIIR